MKQPKLQEKYVDSMKLVTRDRKSNMTCLERVDILSEWWYNGRKTNIFNESERVIRTVAKFLREAIEKNEHESNNYLAADGIMSKANNAVPHLLEVFLKELVKSPIFIFKFSCLTKITLQFGLAVIVDSQLAL